MTLMKNKQPDEYTVHTLQKGLQSGRTNIMRAAMESIVRLFVSKDIQIEWEKEGRLERKHTLK